MMLDPSGQFGSSELRKHLGDNPAEVIRSATCLSQLPPSVNESFELLSEVLIEARDGLRKENIHSLQRRLLPWLNQNPVTLEELPFLKNITPLPAEILEEFDLELSKLEDRCDDPRLSVRNATMEILDLCDGGNRFETEQLRIEEEKKKAENEERQAKEEWRRAVELDRQRRPPKPPLRKIHFFGIVVKQNLLFFDSFRIERLGDKVKLVVPSGKSEAVIGEFKSIEELNQWKNLLDQFRASAGVRFSESENAQLQSKIDSFESMIKQKNGRDEQSSSGSIASLNEPCSPAPEKFIDPLMPSSDKFDMPEYDYQ